MNEKSQIRYTAVGFARFSEADLGNNACYHTKSQIIVQNLHVLIKLLTDGSVCV